MLDTSYETIQIHSGSALSAWLCQTSDVCNLTALPQMALMVEASLLTFCGPT